VGKTIKTVDALDDQIIFGKVGTSGSEVAAALKGKKVSSAKHRLDAPISIDLS
jgi:formamidopyrimidine-DNA glycosylase